MLGEQSNNGNEGSVMVDFPITTKTDHKFVNFDGVIKGIACRDGFCYTNLHQKFSTRFSFKLNGKSLIVNIKKPGFYWKDLIHSA